MRANATASPSRAEPRAFVLLKSRRLLDLLNPDPHAWTDDDLATGLSSTMRWGGASRWELPGLAQVVQEWKMPPREWAEARTDRHGSWRSVQRVWPVGRSHPHYISQAASPDPIPRPRPFAARAVGRVGVLAFVDRETPAPDALRQAGAQSLKLGDPLIDPFRPGA